MPRRTDEPFVQLATRIPKGLHRAIKLRCVEAGVPVMEFVIGAIEERLAQVSGRARAEPRKGERR